MVVHERLNVLGLFPLLAIHFIAANVEVRVRKQRGHFADKLVEKLVSCFARWIHRGIENTKFALDLIRPRAARQLRVSDEPTRGVSRHVEFGYHADAAIARVSDHVANLILRVIVAIGTELVQFWKALALDPESLV